MKTKVDRSPFGYLLSIYLKRVEEIAREMGYRIVGKDVQLVLRARAHLKRAVAAPEVTVGLALSMTALVMTIGYDDLDKPDPTISRYAVEFAVENRMTIAEVILTETRHGD